MIEDFSKVELHEYYLKLADIEQAEDEEERASFARNFVCKFFQAGEHTKCIGCKQRTNKVNECTDNSIHNLRANPTKVWYEGWTTPITKNANTSAKDILPLACDTCYFNTKCPVRSPGSTCRLNFVPSDLDNTSPASIYDFMIELQLERVGRARIIEQFDGGTPDAMLSNEMERLNSLIAAKAALSRPTLSMNLTATGASQESGGILSKIFGSMSTPTEETKKLPESSLSPIQEVSYEEVKEPSPISKIKKKLKS